MKKIIFLTSALTLAACGGGSGGGTNNITQPIIPNTPNTPSVPTDVDLTVTSLSETADNTIEINTYVESILGTDFNTTPNSAPIHNRYSTSRSDTSDPDRNSRNQEYIEDMKTFFEISDPDSQKEFISNNKHLVKQYAELACGHSIQKSEFDFDAADTDSIYNYLKNDKFKWQDIWEKHHYKQEHLSDQKLYSGAGSRDWDEGYVKITELNNGKIKNIKIMDTHREQELDFRRDGNKGFYATPYKYVLQCGAWCAVVYRTNETNLSINQIKKGLLESIDPDAPESERQKMAQAIESITKDTTPTAIASSDFIETEDQDITKLYYIPTQMHADVKAYGKTLGLRYSDFGTVRGTYQVADITGTKNGLGYIFAGGYGIKQVDPKDMSGKMTFSGTAYGSVMYHTNEWDGTATDEYLDIESDAKLVFDNGKETLTMNFSENKKSDNKWYDIKYTKENDIIDIELTNGDKIATQNQKFMFNDIENGGKVNEKTFADMTNKLGYHDTTLENGRNLVQLGSLDTKYYGDNDIPSEAVGTTTLMEQLWGGDPNKVPLENEEIFFNAAFGVTKDK